MGKKDKQKKGKGAEKTSKKTQLKLERKVMKVEKVSGEQSIEQLIAEFKKEQEKLTEVTVITSAPPSPRSHFTFTASPETNELLLFGGEYFDGKKTTMYSDLFVYHCTTMVWDLVRSPTTPPPRSGHQAVFIKTNTVPASVWIFGGEYASPTQVRFYHYKDLWSLRIRTRKWELVRAEGGSGPCARSGHRMLSWKNSILLFGGFSDTGRRTLYFNDLWQFDITSLHWTMIRLAGDLPAPRSACLFFPGVDLKTVYILGGYRKEALSKEVEKGVACTDFFRITLEKDGLAANSCSVRQSGVRPKPPRTAMAGVLHAANSALLFGGVHDVETDDGECVLGHFHNDMFVFELDKAKWHIFNYVLPRQTPAAIETGQKEPELSVAPNGTSVPAVPSQLAHSVFTLTLGTRDTTGSGDHVLTNKVDTFKQILPPARSSAGFVVLGSILYVYGGVFEVGDRKITLDDFYSLDLNRPASWQCLYPGTQAEQEWYGSDLDENDDEEDAHEMNVDSAEDSTSDDDDDDEELVEEAPILEPNETYIAYWERTSEFWFNLVKRGLDEDELNSNQPGPSTPSPTLTSLAQHLAKDFYQKNTRTTT
ncbi:hypothetical protein CRM22_003869 [Opisthorchis felineus]|uniref:DUF4110 domain-containing protein n=1 Tax=Opisthorchis felineus TaxID=147828 RepID=A0A4S2M5A1_OPIFE|nr:hypothetical protein CRM22_003869 [Opisthorchis felineus]